MTALHFQEIATVAPQIANRELSPVELTQTLLNRIERLEVELRSFVSISGEAALAAARMAEREIALGQYRGPLHGIPVAIKDLFWTEGTATAGGMAIHRDFRPGRDATAVRRLREAGCIVLGKLKTTEGAYSDHHPAIKAPINPWDGAYWTGISSSGPGVALAAGLCFGALASDTGGSIRWPCGANGLTGLKPTWGRVSRDGVFALAPSMDHVGPMARSARDVGILFEAIAGPDPLDLTARQVTAPVRPAPMAGVRIGLDASFNETDVDEPVRAALRNVVTILRDLGGVMVDIDMPSVTQAVLDWPDLCAVEAAVAHVETYPARSSEYGPVLAQVLERGRTISGIDLQRLQLRRMQLCGAFAQLFTSIDVLLCPVQPFAPIKLATLGVMGERPDMIARLQRFTCPFNMIGAPSLTLPCGHDAEGMPIGFQIVGDCMRENLVIGVGIAFQAATDMHGRWPDRFK